MIKGCPICGTNLRPCHVSFRQTATLYAVALNAAVATVKYHEENKLGYSIPEVLEFAKLYEQKEVRDGR